MKIAFCGDIMLNSPELHSIGKKLSKKLKDCDIRCINFEAPVRTSEALGIHKSGPVLDQSAKTPAWLRSNGFNLITLANNHALDHGQKGIESTISYFEEMNITGVGRYNDAYNFTVIEKGNQKIGFLGLTHKEFGCVDIDSGEQLGTAMLTSPKVFKSIIETKPYIDKLFILPHAGVEYLDIPLPEWRELYKTFIDIGANGVIASHPHVPQGYEFYKGSPIFYSLGNFLFEREKPLTERWFKSIVVILDTTTNDTEVLLVKYDYANKTVEIDSSEEAQTYFIHLNNLLKEENYRQKIEEESVRLRSTYHNMMKNGGAYSFGLKEKLKNLIRPLIGRKKIKTDQVHLLNLFQCESHRWMMMRLLKSLK
ncbi:MAG: CapA family protein [Muribaculaceae bacterium]|nr:CapA family protein [Muribaculaceae bacterium]